MRESSGERRKWLLLAAVALTTLSSIRLVDAGGLLYFVNTTSDTVVAGACTNGLDNCSLRGAIQAANSHPGEDGIDFNLPGGSVINLASALPPISDSISIFGPGASALTVRRNASAEFRIFQITAGGAVALSGMTITNGAADISNDPHGGGVQNTNGGTLSMSDCVITANSANEGGGIDNHAAGIINLTNCTISDNGATVNGGIYNHGGGTVNITNCVITTNTAFRFGGGGIYTSSGVVNVTNSLIDNNRSQERGGGGIKSVGGTVTVIGSAISNNIDEADDGGGIYSGAGVFSLTSCSISGNSTPHGGGGGIINLSGATLTLTNCTVGGNSQASDQDSGGGLRNEGTAIISNSTFTGNSALTDGGAISNSGTLTITNSTIARNSATGTTHSAGDGAGIANGFAAPSIQIKSTIVALNTGPGASPDIVGSFTSGGFNLIGKLGTAAGFNVATDQKGSVAAPLDPKLAGLLQGNGGPTETIALLFGSPAIDKGTSNSLIGTLTTDQRGTGFPRTFDDPATPNAAGGNGTDIGAFELQTAPAVLANISTRLRVETSDNVLIGGFIITGTQPKKIIVRAIGPSLPLAGALADPILELRNSSGGLILSNNNWRDDPVQEAEIIATTIPPSNDLESAIVATLPANNSAYTAIVRGVNNGTGVGLVEAYDLDHTVDSKLANISTRGLVQTGDNVLIAGTIVLGTAAQKVIVRAIGPSLPVPGALADPTLELRDGNGTLLHANDNWRIGGQEAEIIATSIPPTNDLESALIHTLPAGGASYTAIVRGLNNGTGVALVEIYAIN